MTPHDGSRASGSPPDFVSFRRRAGARFAGARRHRSLGRSRPPSLWEALFGNVTKSAGPTNRMHRSPTRDTDVQRTAAPTRATLRHAANGARRFSTGKVLTGADPNERSAVG